MRQNMSNVFGKLTPYNTIIHRLDPRLKFFTLIALMVMCFLPYGNYTNRFIVLGVLALIIIVIMAIAKIRISSIFSSLKSLWFMMFFLHCCLSIYKFQLHIDYIKNTKK